MLTKLISQLNDMGYRIAFCPDFEGMVRLELTIEDDSYTLSSTGYYKHWHLGYPECPTDKLEKSIIECLAKFITEEI